MDRNQKEASVEELDGIFANAGSVVMAHYTGMTVAEMTELRAKLREQGGTFKVVRNRLAKIALQGKPGEGAADLFAGPVAIAYSEDFVAAPKVLVDFAKSNDKLVILGGFMDEEIFDSQGIDALSKMPTREELLASAGELFDVLKSGIVTIDITATYPLSDAARAHDDLEGRKTSGSIVFTV